MEIHKKRCKVKAEQALYKVAKLMLWCTSLGNGGASPSHFLLQFYAAECGIKSIYLRQKRLKEMDDVSNKKLNDDGHNLHQWAKEIKLPRHIVETNPKFKLPKRTATKDWALSTAHQAWRYGAVMDQSDEAVLVAWLESICSWISERI